MAFAHLVFRNLLRARVRSTLTLAGISLGITTIVALGVITAGLKSTGGAWVRAGGADFIVAQEGAADMTFSILPEERVSEIEAVAGVRSAEGVLMHVTRVGENPLFFVVGVAPEGFPTAAPRLVAGRYVGLDAPTEIVLGASAAEDLGAEVGDTIDIDARPFEVVGVADSEVVWEQSGAFMPLVTVQALANRGQAVTLVRVSVDAREDVAEIADRIESSVPGVVTITTADEIGQVDSGFQVLGAANIAISGLAVVIGGIGVMNTMVMSVFERTREIGVLRAVGWSGWRVVRMILLEGLMLCVAAAVVGTALGLLAVQAVMRVPEVRGFIEPSYEPEVFVQAVLVAVGVALVGAAYPAYRATRLTPMEALRYE